MIKYLFVRVYIGKISRFFFVYRLFMFYINVRRNNIYKICQVSSKRQYMSPILNKQFGKILHCFAFKRMLREKIERYKKKKKKSVRK